MSTTTRAIEEEYWAIQYKTSTLGGVQFWPPDGEGHYSSDEVARSAFNADRFQHSVEMRVLHITRRIEYGPTIEREVTP